ncbi:hypothetical protein [Variovorax ginsengisoli]|uniref:Uncharacterized protein n=1 Tax=Variovorax ginsengisoli TaxID=363844 RepID=A0ABT9S3W5_9BURK|nr:hypothetical protein [Variovorax ginsengisoli]MDP9898072.1 hypothetical protein [Variovorax ginsengisoli]
MGIQVAGSAHACSRSFSTDLDFAAGSAVLEKDEIVKLVAWLDKWRAVFSRFESVLVDGIAPANAEDAKTLSRLRAEATTRAVRQLLEGVPISTSSHLNWPTSKFKGGNYVGIDLIPFQEDMPDCGKPIK